MMVKPRPEINALRFYTPGTSIEDALKASGRSQMIKLASNESLWGPSPKALHAAQEALASMQHYPPLQSEPLREALAAMHHLSSNQVLAGNGADEILRLIAAAYVAQGQSVVYPTPSFSAYHHSVQLAGGHSRAIPLDAAGGNDLEAMRKAITADTRLLYLCAPNNPTGIAVTRSAWLSFLTAIPDHVLIVVDGAYQEFTDDSESPDFLDAVRAGYPVVVVRTFSKLYALANLRVGWAAAHPDIIRALFKSREPFSLNGIGMAAAAASLEDTPYFTRVLRETLEARRHFMEALSQRQISYFPSQANFVTMAVGGEDRLFADRLLQLGFVVRPTSSFGLFGHVRVTIGPIPVMDKLLEALDQVME